MPVLTDMPMTSGTRGHFMVTAKICGIWLQAMHIPLRNHIQILRRMILLIVTMMLKK
jgi:hypothetical protein